MCIYKNSKLILKKQKSLLNFCSKKISPSIHYQQQEGSHSRLPSIGGGRPQSEVCACAYIIRFYLSFFLHLPGPTYDVGWCWMAWESNEWWWCIITAAGMKHKIYAFCEKASSFFATLFNFNGLRHRRKEWIDTCVLMHSADKLRTLFY